MLFILTHIRALTKGGVKKRKPRPAAGNRMTCRKHDEDVEEMGIRDIKKVMREHQDALPGRFVNFTPKQEADLSVQVIHSLSPIFEELVPQTTPDTKVL
jgi:hypothetical protein